MSMSKTVERHRGEARVLTEMEATAYTHWCCGKYERYEVGAEVLLAITREFGQSPEASPRHIAIVRQIVHVTPVRRT